MRICYICPTRTPHIKAYIDYFAARGHEIHIVSLTRDPLDCATVHYIGLGDRLSPLRYLVCSPHVTLALRRIKPDVCHAHWITSNGWMAALAHARPLIVTEHGAAMQQLNNVLRKKIVNFVAKKAELINPVSQALADLMAGAGISREKMFVAPVGVETLKFDTGPKDFSQRPLQLINTRAFRSLDKLDVLANALAELKGRSVEFHCTFAGPKGPEYQHVRSLIEKHQLGDYCTFLEGYDPATLPSILERHQVYISCNSFDGTSISLLEAMSAGLAVVASDIPANRDWIRNEFNGLLVPVGDSAPLADALEKLYNNPGLSAQYSYESIKVVRSSGERAVILSKLEERYFDMAEGYKKNS